MSPTLIAVFANDSGRRTFPQRGRWWIFAERSRRSTLPFAPLNEALTATYHTCFICSPTNTAYNRLRNLQRVLGALRLVQCLAHKFDKAALDHLRAFIVAHLQQRI